MTLAIGVRPENAMWFAGGAAGISAFFDKNYDLSIVIIVLSNYGSDEAEPVYSQIRKIVHGLKED